MEEITYAVGRNIYIFVIVGVVVGLLVQLYARMRRQKLTVNNSSALVLAAVLNGKPMLIDDGNTPGNYRYAVIMGLNSAGFAGGNGGYALFSVELPFVSSAHLVGIARDRPPHIDVDESASSLKPMDLEGDHGEYFKVYVGNDDQTNGRYVLDPKAMVFTIDFCRQFHWEIRDDMLYFLSDMKTVTFPLVEQFISEIKPAIDSGKPLSPGGHTLPYVSISPARMDCPVCDEELVNEDDVSTCPNGHGQLLEGKQLIELRAVADAKDLRGALDHQSGEELSERVLKCPYCHSPMKRNRFQQTSVYIDVCTSCRYRWVDQHEIEKTLGVIESKKY